MTRTEQLDPIALHTDKKQRQALQAMVTSQQQLDIEQAKIDQLQSYKIDYLSRQTKSNMTCSAIELQEFKRFIDQLDQTIQQQSQIVNSCQRALEHKRQIWQSTCIDSKAIHKVMDNLHKAELIQEDRREQKIMDEFAQRKIKK